MFTIPAPNSLNSADISGIPPEILSEIFIHCLAVDSTSQNIRQLLGSVCRLWREIVLATPALWASLDITYSCDALCPPLPVIRTHLQRSRMCPLSIVLHAVGLGPGYSDGPQPHLSTALTVLVAARRRWRNVHIELHTMTQEILELIMLGDAPLLQSLQCDVVEYYYRTPVPLNILHHFPHLESFKWRSPRSRVLLPLCDTPLTSLSLQVVLTIPDCVTLLRLSPRLSSAKFSALIPLDSSTTPCLTHPTLRTLTAVGAHFIALMDALTLPALQELDLQTGQPSPPPSDWGVKLLNFLIRSKPPLHQLRLTMSYTRNIEFVLPDILILTPHLRSLSLSGARPCLAPFTDMTIHALYPSPPPSTPACPRLQTLRISSVSHCPDGPCGAMLRARWGVEARANRVACLESVDIEFIGGVHDRDQADMKQLCAEGMRGTLRLSGP